MHQKSCVWWGEVEITDQPCDGPQPLEIAGGRPTAAGEATELSIVQVPQLLPIVDSCLVQLLLFASEGLGQIKQRSHRKSVIRKAAS